MPMSFRVIPALRNAISAERFAPVSAPGWRSVRKLSPGAHCA